MWLTTELTSIPKNTARLHKISHQYLKMHISGISSDVRGQFGQGSILNMVLIDMSNDSASHMDCLKITLFSKNVFQIELSMM